MVPSLRRTSVLPISPSPPPATPRGGTPGNDRGRLLQVGAFSDPSNAVVMREELEALDIDQVMIRVGQLDNGDTVHRVILGPFDQRQRMDEARIRLRTAGYEPINIAE